MTAAPTAAFAGAVAEGLVLFVLPWLAVLGTSGAMLARGRGGSATAGLLLGVCLGPLGWVACWVLTRDAAVTGGFDALGTDLVDDGWGSL